MPVSLRVSRRRKNLVQIYSDVPTQALRLYKNWDVPEGTPFATIPWGSAAVPDTPTALEPSMQRLRGKWVLQFNPETYGLDDDSTFFMRMVQADGTVEDLAAVLPVFTQNNPVEVVRGLVGEDEIYIPFGRMSRSMSVLNMGSGGNTLLFRFTPDSQYIELPAQTGWDEKLASASGIYARSSGPGATELMASVVLLPGGA